VKKNRKMRKTERSSASKMQRVRRGDKGESSAYLITVSILAKKQQKKGGIIEKQMSGLGANANSDLVKRAGVEKKPGKKRGGQF